MAAEQISVDQIPPGRILTYYGDIASGAIRPEDVKIEALTFRAAISATGQIGPSGQGLITTDKITVNARYNFAIRSIRTTIENEELAGAAPSLIRFNVVEQGRNFNVFKQPVDFEAAMTPTGAVPYDWDGVYICVPGTDLAVEWTIESVLWTALVGVPKNVKLTITGDYIACEPTTAQPRP